MRKLTYYAVIEPSKDGYSVYFPDLPGCIGYGPDIVSAEQDAKESLELHIYGMERDGDTIAEPSVTFDQAEIEGCILSPVTIFPDIVKNEMDNRRVKTNVTIPAWLKELAEANKVNYSRLLEVALLEYLGVNPRKIR